MHFSVEQTIDAPTSLVQSAFLDPHFYEALDRAPNLSVREVLERTQRANTEELRVRFAFTGNVSSAVRAVVDPAKLTWVTVISFDRDTDRWTFRVVPDHYPDRLQGQGTYQLVPQGERTLRTTEGDLRVRVPLVGSSVERAIISGFRQHLATEADLLASWPETS